MITNYFTGDGLFAQEPHIDLLNTMKSWADWSEEYKNIHLYLSMVPSNQLLRLLSKQTLLIFHQDVDLFQLSMLNRELLLGEIIMQDSQEQVMIFIEITLCLYNRLLTNQLLKCRWVFSIAFTLMTMEKSSELVKIIDISWEEIRIKTVKIHKYLIDTQVQ